jgi:hypothetical protein
VRLVLTVGLLVGFAGRFAGRFAAGTPAEFFDTDGGADAPVARAEALEVLPVLGLPALGLPALGLPALGLPALDDLPALGLPALDDLPALGFPEAGGLPAINLLETLLPSNVLRETTLPVAGFPVADFLEEGFAAEDIPIDPLLVVGGGFRSINFPSLAVALTRGGATELRFGFVLRRDEGIERDCFIMVVSMRMENCRFCETVHRCTYFLRSHGQLQ